MSLLWVSAASHYPIYEVGDTSDWDEQPDPTHSQITRYTDKDRVAPDSMGIPHRDTSRLRWNTIGGSSDDTLVPTHTLQASQAYLYAPHVRNLATLPAEAFDETHSWDPVSVVRTKDGHHVVMDGHHRAAAAILRGDKHLRVQLDGTEV